MSWAARRQFVIVSILLLITGGLVFWYYAPVIFVQPSCTDLKQNGDEVGVDCGGVCTNFCASQIKSPTVLWSRAFKVADSVHNAVAYIENQNGAGSESLPYEFRLYDEKGVFVARVQGVAVVPPSGSYAVVETGIQTGTANITSTTFEFGKSTAPWMRIDDEISKLRLSSSSIALDTTGVVPRLSATLTNTSPTTTLRDVSVAAILYDASNNAITASKTFVSEFAPQTSQAVFFTWPKAIATPVVRYDILPTINVFTSSK